ncbi:PEP-CTERM sorting domain-containing protein [Geobacter hydrogenophilus]|uniref:Ice-binding protein C-terminal domain-containing protein n=1 Tax=Geobacter hydrogenophilus TaxID=40983 RepID=A0A9W6LBT1_9BACT|nr:PEP-CTERM sorting domain-containing protein [Geobacter hydrogenophilus]MBT0895640.1 PEP-CTERM sorting domain-containing protein [Geobacter hydrogenophilus]GLI36811.1 hypothetical protein GHYDROH2_03120 [Geobacter hydrogenophilus]
MCLAKGIFSVFMMFFCCFSLVRTSNAYVFATSDMKLYNLSFSTTDGNARLVWNDRWYGQVTAYAQDTATGSNGDSNYLLDNDGKIRAQADSFFVHSWAEYQVANGANVAIGPGASIVAMTHSSLEISELGAQGDGGALSFFDNFFSIVKNDPDVPGTTVQGIFLLDYLGHLGANADSLGYFSTALAGKLEVWEVGDRELLGSDLINEIHSGRGEFSGTYTGTLQLDAAFKYYSSYYLSAEADSEVYGANAVPEPGTVALVAVGCGFLFWKGRRKS